MSDSTSEGQGGAAAKLGGRLKQRLVDPDLLARIERLEAEAAESRALSLRIAELTELVAELVVPLAQADPERAQELLERYRSGLGS